MQPQPRLVKDAIHNSLEVSELELRVIDSPIFQRLRFVRQLSTAYLVYPSATHTRFEHSLGAMHLTGTLSTRLGLGEEQTRMLRLAALLHDVGHGAFAHTSDPILEELVRKKHEERGIDLVKKTGLHEIIEGAGVNLKELASCMQGHAQGAILTRELGTDRIDYLLRDAHFTGVAYSIIDADRLLHTLQYDSDDGLLVEERGVLAAESMLVSRHFMFKAVYFHPTVRITGEMVACAIRAGLAEKAIKLEDVALGTDERLLLKLEAGGTELAKRLLERRLYKAAFSLDASKATHGQARALSQKDFRKKFEKHMRESGFAQGDYVVCTPETHTSHYKTRVLMKDGSTRLLEDVSSLVRALEQERRENAFIVATARERREECAKAAQEFFPAP